MGWWKQTPKMTIEYRKGVSMSRREFLNTRKRSSQHQRETLNTRKRSSQHQRETLNTRKRNAPQHHSASEHTPFTNSYPSISRTGTDPSPPPPTRDSRFPSHSNPPRPLSFGNGANGAALDGEARDESTRRGKGTAEATRTASAASTRPSSHTRHRPRRTRRHTHTSPAPSSSSPR